MNTSRTRTALTAGIALSALVGVAAPLMNASAATTTVANTQVRIGMSSPEGEWDTRLQEVGGVDARRIFGQLSSPDGPLRTARSEVEAGRMAVLSFKVPNNNWSGAANGVYDTQLSALRDRLAALPGQVFVTLHHEPAGDGTAADFAAMQSHVLPILSPPSNVDAGVIVNGFWWSSRGQGLTDAQIAAWLPADVLAKSEVVASDTYQGGTTANQGENAGVKIRNMSAWATRVGVTRLGIGEYNGLDAAAITAAGDAVLADPRFIFACVFNSNHNNRAGVSWQLEGDRIDAFKRTVSLSREARTSPSASSVSSPSPSASSVSSPTPSAVSSPTPAAVTSPTTEPNKTVNIGMSSPSGEWQTRLQEVGGVDSRRIFGQLDSPTSALNLAKSEISAGRMPVLSFKVPGNDWAGAAKGRYDATLRDLTAKLDAMPGRLFVTLHHEPAKDGTATDFAAMQRHVLPILSPPSNVDAGVIVNGFWWSSQAQRLTDAEIAQWLPAQVLQLSEVVGADTYHGGTLSNQGENAAVKIKNMGAWATRVGVRQLGLGEFNGLDAAAVKAAGDAVLADPRFVFACVFNSNKNNREGVNWQLSGQRLDAFKQTVQQSRGARATG